MKLTPWFPADVKPARPGVYMTNMGGPGFGYSRWTGKRWGFYMSTEHAAATTSCRGHAYQHKKWRGLAHNPRPLSIAELGPGCMFHGGYASGPGVAR